MRHADYWNGEHVLTTTMIGPSREWEDWNGASSKMKKG